MTVGQMEMQVCIVRKSVNCFQCSVVCLFISEEEDRIETEEAKTQSGSDRTCPSPPAAALDYPKQGFALNWPHYAVFAQPPTSGPS